MSPANGDAAGLERQIADLSPAQRALLERRLLRRGGAAGAASRIPSRADRGACPLSFAQQRLWFLAQLDPDSAAFNQPTALRLVGRLDRDALRGALQAVVDRHEMLRTTFGAVDGVPFQVVGPAPSVALPVVEVPAPDREEQLSEALRAEGRRPFDLSRDPMLRATLFALGPEEHALLVDVHHIAADGWSKGVLLQEVAAAYGALVRGEPAVMPALPIQYADYAVWQRERLQTTGIETDLAYWKSALEGAPAICDVPTDRPRRDPRGWQGDRVGTELSPALCRALREVSRGEQATLFTTLLAAYQAVLGRYAGQDDVLVAVPVAGRDRTETQGLIGILVNVLCFRADLSGNPSFRELLGRVRDVVLAGLGHQELPFERLVEELHPDRRMTHAPIVQVSFNLLPFEDRLPALEGLQVSRLPFDIEAVNYDLSLVAASDGDGLRIGLRFATDILSASTASRMLRHWVTLLEGVAADPSARVWSVPLLSAMERRQALVQWNPPPPAAAPPACLHELFEAQVARRPDAVALTCGAERFTYRELDARARGLAHVLRTKGVGPDVLVGLCVEPSLDLVVGLLAILKAGGAYLPLDPAYPAGRLAFMVEDARLAVVVVQKHLIDRLPAGPVTFVGVDEGVQPEDGGTAGRSPVHPDNLAYVIYTSGSSGQPKGVQVTHANVARLLSATEPWFGFDERDVWTLFHSFAFDFSVWELWGALAYGGRLVVVPYLTSRSPESFADLLRAEGVTVLNQTPSAFRQLAAADAARGDAGGLALRAVVFGGEALEPGALAPWVERHDDGAPRLVNMYGITETTVHVTYRPLAATEIRGGIGSVIGQPIPDLQVHVLDRVMEPAPVGVAGELYVGGRGLARGYLNRPDLTAERFVPDPFATDGGRRLYRTGDLGRRLPDGDVEYLGRADQQIKLRGFRIELGEIEAALRAVPGVGDATVGLTGGGTADASLLAHVVFDGPAAPAAELRAALRRTLPDYMIPAAFVPMAALPLTANGKLDRRALPAPVARAWDGDEAPAPVIDDALTRDVAAIWARVLRVPSVAPDDDFFDLGGHSLLAVRLAAEMGELAGGRFPVVTIFRAPTLDATVAALREMISHAAPEAALAEEAPAEAIPHRQGDGAARPLSFAQQRLWFLDQLEPGTASYNVPVALRLVGPLRVDALRGAIDTVVARHEALRTSFVVSDGGPAQVVHEPAALDLPVTDLARLAGPDRESALARLLAEEAHRPFDLARDLLVRPSLYSLGPEEHVLLLMMHHIGADAWSLGVLYRELGTAYAALAGGAAPALPPLTTQYADFAAWQRDWLRGTRLEQHVTYWKEALAGAPAMLDLPTDHPRREERTWRGARVSARVSPEVAERLQGLGRRQGATLFMVLAAAFQAVLCRHSGQDDIVVGVPIAGRDRLDTQGLIGLFLNAFCLRTDLSGNPTFLDLVDRVRAAAVSAYAHQALPFEKLVEELAPDRTLGRSPLFQVLFNLMEVEDNVLVLPGLAVSPVPIEFETSKYDLALSVSRRDGGLSAGLRYSSDLFTAATAERMLGHWMTLLEAVAAAPERRLLDLPLLGPAESRARAAQVARARPRLERSGFPRAALERSVGARFEEQARRHASRIAVRGRRHAWTYGELDRRANRLAHALVARGAAGGRVALLLGHDAPMMAGILGVLKAGCAYVPLDPFYPRERLVAVVADAQASTLVTESRHAPLAGELAPGGVEILDVDDPGPAARDDDPGVVVSPDALAYLLYTSGSTGRPKGVMQTHRNLLHHIRVYTDNLGLTPDDRLTLFASYAFDAALMDIFGALLNGARLCPWSVREDGLVGAPAWLRDEEITVFHSTPTLYRHFVASLGDGDGFPSVRSVVMGGEEVLRTDVAAFARHFAPGAVFVNGLGPTESTLALQCFLDRDSELPAGRVPVGDPVEDTEVVLLDEEGRAAASGEITIASPHVALGYWRQPEQTAQAFRPDPTDPARRVYHTGDLGRLRADGTLEFLGRKDFQVKIRGFRIEPGEIEAQLRSERTLREAVVVPRAERPGEQRLVAYVVPMPGAVVTAADLRGALQERLPDYMVPATFVTLDALPLTPTGKIDRLALPAPPPVDGARDQGDGAPQDGLERDLAEIWAKVLGVSSVGRHDNFFELGGHSLLALRLFADIERLTGRSLPLATVFRAPTIAELAARLRAEVVEHTTSLVPLQPRGALPPLYCVHQHTGHLFCYRHLVAHLGPEQPAFGLAPPGLDGMETPIDRIEHLAAHYLGAIRARQARGPYHLLGYCFGGVVAFEMAHQLLAQGEDVALLAMIETAWRPPLTRAQRWALRTRRRFGYELDLVRRRRPLERPPFAAFRLGSLLLEVATRGLSRRVEPESPDEETTFVDAAIERVAKAHTAARQRYRPSVYPGRIVLFRSANLPARHFGDPCYGWDGLAKDGIEVEEIVSSTPTLVDEPTIQSVAARLGAHLAAARTSP